MAEDRNTYKIHDNGSLGEVQKTKNSFYFQPLFGIIKHRIFPIGG